MLCAVPCVEFPSGCCTERGDLRLELSQALLSLGDAREETLNLAVRVLQRFIVGWIARDCVVESELLEVCPVEPELGVVDACRVGLRTRLMLSGRTDLVGERLAKRRSIGVDRREIGRRSTGAGVAAADLGPQARAETVFLCHFSAELLHQRLRQLGRGDQIAFDEDLAKAQTRRCLLREGILELFLADQASFDEQLADRTPRDLGRFHAPHIGMRQETLEMSRSSANSSDDPLMPILGVHDSGAFSHKACSKASRPSPPRDGRDQL